jgi:DNA-binding response OmpR family regulator
MPHSDSTPSHSPASRAVEPKGPDPLILVVDDDLFNVDLLLFELEDAGYRALGVSSAREALRRLEQDPPVDLILLDVMMPGMDGLELTQLLKRDIRTRDIPIILLTARGELGDKAQGFSAGAEDYVVKPFDAEEVLARVEVQLRIRRLRIEQERLGTARARLAMIGAAAHQLSQPLSGATGFLQLLQVLFQRGGSPGSEQERLLQVDHCLERAMTLARQLSELHQFRTEDYACGTEIVDLEASIRPTWQEDTRSEPVVLVADPVSESAPSWLNALRGENWNLRRVIRPEQCLESAPPWVMVLNQVPPKGIPDWLEATRRRAEAPGSGPGEVLPPFTLLVSRATTGGFRGAALRAGVDDILAHPPHSEELLMRIRSRLTLYRLQEDQLRLNSLVQARIVGERAFASFQPMLDSCRLQVAELLSCQEGPERGQALERLSRCLEGLTGTIRQLQARQLPDAPAGTPR